MKNQESQAPTAERRSRERVLDNRPMSLTIDAATFAGHSRDLSESSVFFLSDAEMSVRVTFEDPGGATRHGKLVRYQRMPGGGSGWAVEFDD